MVYAAIRIRGTVNLKPDIKKTMNLLRLNQVNHCVILQENPLIKGMLQLSKDYITWGEINKEILSKLLTQRGRLFGDKRISDDYLISATSYKSIDILSESIINNKIRINEIPDIKPVFRLNPPKGGYEGIKRSFINKGALGYRGEKINTLLQRMI